MHPGVGWSVFAPTDNIVNAKEGVLAEWSFVDRGEVNPRFARRMLPYLGPSWMHRCAVENLRDRGLCKWHDIKWSFQPTCILPATTFHEPVQKMLDAWH